ncbi:hypothetical protein [Mycolicibacterium komossense]|uniref:Uncharacterized protein n=1 Tax=Mycolicibacterium komossense TaxID=1779 RepID=A0ABT3CFT2_9MYCO|nr:hypothetical protein [Mycolicibacterium komossense]MCV7228274.1 hypothetical protein [Mycolicibacterium komossense]
MFTKFDDVLTSPPSGRSVPLILDHAAYGSTRILRGAPVPWSEPVECQSYFGQAQGLLRPDTTLVDIGAAYDQQLSTRPGLIDAMGARSRTGYALKTLLADDDLTACATRLVEVLGKTSRQPVVLQIPAPLRWLALAQSRCGKSDLTGIEPDHGESASMYLADWLRRFEALPITLLLLDGRRNDDPALTGLVPEDLVAYTPVVNAVEHYRWGLAMRTDDELTFHGGAPGAVVPQSFWTDGIVPPGRALFAEVPADAEPETVLAQLARLH